MKVLLLKNVAKVGRQYQVKEISDGYARNFLIPRGFAEPVTSQNMKKVEALKSKHTESLEAKKAAAQELIEKLADTTLVIKVKANGEGHLFASVNEAVISKELDEQHHVTVPSDHIKLPEPIKEVGEYTVEISSEDSKGSIKLKVEAE